MFSTGPRWRSAVADTFALVVYCFVIGMAIEVVISGMTFRQSVMFDLPVRYLLWRGHLAPRPILSIFRSRYRGLSAIKIRAGALIRYSELPAA